MQERISNSWALLFDSDKNVLKSSHLEVSGSDASWNKSAGAVETETYSYKLDTAGKDRYFLKTSSKEGSQNVTTESYLMNDGQEAYAVVDGKVQPSYGLEAIELAFLPIAVGIPIVFAATGASAAGQETVDGRLADKFAVDTAKAPSGVVGALGTMFTLRSAKGTVWIDRQSGALLKANIEYRQAFVDPPGSATVVGEGSGRFDLSVTRVGRVTVVVPK